MKASTATAEPLAPTRRRPRLNNCVKKVNWTREEDQLLCRLTAQSPGPRNWPCIAASFPNKTTQQVTERWEKVLDPHLVKGSWTREEDEIIVNFVREHGCNHWSKLSHLLPGRIGKQCRERWLHHLDPSINRASWTREEDEKLIELHETLGNAWVKIAQFMPGRSDNAIKNRWNSVLRKQPERPKVEPSADSSPPRPSPAQMNRAKLLCLLGGE